MSLGFLDLAAVSTTTITTALLFSIAKLRVTSLRQQNPPLFPSSCGRVSFLLENDTLIDCSQEGTALLSQTGEDTPDRNAVIAVLEPIFPEIGLTLANDIVELTTILSDKASDQWLEISPLANRLRISICGNPNALPAGQAGSVAAPPTIELATLREIADNSPQLMWRTNPSGQLIWANDAYLSTSDACAELSTNPSKLPSVPLFQDFEEQVSDERTTARCSVKLRDDSKEHWFDVTAVKSPTGTLHFATDADAVVRAELGQRNFVQTLSQTFAQLSIGLAIFDRRRQLATFNPAMLDMTNLPFEFLSSRPSIDTVLDRLRELRMLPEPKNYTSWREQFSAMEQAAKDGTYCENWDLPDGQTFRVTGRPHPDGCFALLFEDISAEISLTRRFRSEIETSQSVLDTLDEAVAVFSNGGNLMLANTAYCTLWDTDLDHGLNRYDLRVELRKWQSRCTPTRIWTNLREFTSQMGSREPWSETAILDDGRQLTCIASPIHGGMTMIKFRFGGVNQAEHKTLGHKDLSLVGTKGLN